jgi:hypothetical protein
MAEHLIQSETLDEIADAINAKTGGSAAMTPAEMVTAIGSISGGGGRTLLADYTASEDVSAIQIDFTQAMQGYDLYEILFTGTFNKQPYPYVGVNTSTNTSYLNGFNSNHNWGCFIGKINNQYGVFFGSRVGYPISELQYFHTRVYVADAFFMAGFNIKIWGYTA